jgi:hypothetical protein
VESAMTPQTAAGSVATSTVRATWCLPFIAPLLG